MKNLFKKRNGISRVSAKEYLELAKVWEHLAKRAIDLHNGEVTSEAMECYQNMDRLRNLAAKQLGFQTVEQMNAYYENQKR